MLLAVDIGNTNIVLGCMEGPKVLFTERLSTDTVKTELEYAILFDTALKMHHLDAQSVDGGIISSVVPQITSVIHAALEKLCGVDSYVVGPGIRTGLNIRMDDPSSVGADLIVGAVGAISKYTAPIIIIDMGTATTMTVVDAQKSFIGGIIMPGIRVSLKSIVSEAAMLQGISLKMPSHVIGSNTNDALRSGILLGSAATLDGMIDKINEEIHAEAVVVATGGWSSRIIHACRHKIIHDENLLLDGLYLIYERNKH